MLWSAVMTGRAGPLQDVVVCSDDRQGWPFAGCCGLQ